MPLTISQIQEQKKQAEELLFSGPERRGFAKSLFFGDFPAQHIFPYPQVDAVERPVLESAVAALRDFGARKLGTPLTMESEAG